MLIADQFISVNKLLMQKNTDYNQFSQRYGIPFVSEAGTLLPRDKFVEIYINRARQTGDHMQMTTRYG